MRQFNRFCLWQCAEIYNHFYQKLKKDFINNFQLQKFLNIGKISFLRISTFIIALVRYKHTWLLNSPHFFCRTKYVCIEQLIRYKKNQFINIRSYDSYKIAALLKYIFDMEYLALFESLSPQDRISSHYKMQWFYQIDISLVCFRCYCYFFLLVQIRYYGTWSPLSLTTFLIKRLGQVM